MRKSFVFSAVFHVVLALVILLGVDIFDSPPPPMVMPVELIEYEEIAEELALEQPPEPEPEPEPEIEPEPEPEPEAEPEEVAAPPQRVEEAVQQPEPEPVPAPTPVKQAKPQLVTKDIPNIRPRDKPKKPSRFNTARIAALLDKRQEEAETQPKKPAPKKTTTRSKPKRTEIEARRVTASIQQAMLKQIEPCWNPPAGASYAEALQVMIHVRLRPDGNLVREPEILDKGRMAGDSFFRAAAEAARRAIQRCAPFELPRADYDVWAFLELNFDPSEML